MKMHGLSVMSPFRKLLDAALRRPGLERAEYALDAGGRTASVSRSRAPRRFDRNRLVAAALVFASANAAAQELAPRSNLRPITSPVRDAGVYHVSLGSWTRRVEATNTSNWDVIYANTCPVGYYAGLLQHELVADEGRIPGPNGPVLCDPSRHSINAGCQCAYDVNAFQIAYCTGLHEPVSVKIGFQHAYVACAAPATEQSFTLTGLPGAPLHAHTCWQVTVDLGASQSFTITADGASCTWAPSDLATNHLFGWTFENLSSVTGVGTSYLGPLIAGEGGPQAPIPSCSMVDGTRWDTLTCMPQGGGPAKWPNNLTEDGFGMDTQNRFRDDTSIPGGQVSAPSGPGCYFFGGNPYCSIHLRVFSDTHCPVPQPGHDFCVPAQDGVIACPCMNPGLAGHGCDNSAATGGALLASSGIASMSVPPSSSVVFTSSGERPTATSILLQGHDPALPQGIQFGMGVRCMYQSLKRLFVHNAIGGVVTAPDASDNTTIPAKSASLGDVINPGETRRYLFYYRDPILIGSCSSQTLNTFNCTQGQSVLWMQ
jgi:hypothetical protein